MLFHLIKLILDWGPYNEIIHLSLSDFSFLLCDAAGNTYKTLHLQSGFHWVMLKSITALSLLGIHLNCVPHLRILIFVLFSIVMGQFKLFLHFHIV